jgi:hypothetical protein
MTFSPWGFTAQQAATSGGSVGLVSSLVTSQWGIHRPSTQQSVSSAVVSLLSCTNNFPNNNKYQSLTALAAVNPKHLADYSSVAVSFFTSIRIPASLIAGSSLGAFFITTNRTVQDPDEETSTVRLLCLFLYRALTLVSLLLSFNTVVTTTNASNRILIGGHDAMASSAYEFMMREYRYESVLVIWSFYSSIFAFLKAIAFRAILEFRLLRKERVRSMLLVLFSFCGLTFNMLHMVNDSMSLTDYPHFGGLTMGVIQMYWNRVWKDERGPVYVLSLLNTIAAVITFLCLIPRAFTFLGQREKEKRAHP